MNEPQKTFPFSPSLFQLKIGILGQRGGWHERSLQRAFEEHGISVPSFPITRLRAHQGYHGNSGIFIDETRLNDFDALIIRAIPGGSLEEIIFRMDALHALEDQGVWIVNSPRTIERTVDKYYTISIMESAGIPVPQTIVTQRFDEAMEAFHGLGEDVVIKPIFGSEGRGMVRVCDKETAYRALRALELGRYVFCLQRYVPHGCQDIRAFVLNGKVIGAITRCSDSWKTNMAQGATATPLSLPPHLVEMSVTAATLLRCDYAGVDILPMEQGGHCLIEVNGIPAWKGFQRATGLDPGAILADYIIDRLKLRNEHEIT